MFFIHLCILLSSRFLKIAISDGIHAVLYNVLDLEIASSPCMRREQYDAHDFPACQPLLMNMTDWDVNI